MAKSLESLNEVRRTFNVMNNERARLQQETVRWVAEKMKSFESEHEHAVVAAVDDGHSVTDVARACIDGDKTPNRNRVYSILKESVSNLDSWTAEFAFEWVPRSVNTAKGDRTVHDVHVILEDFGPEEVTGEFLWRYDMTTKDLEPVLSEGEPYPTTLFYRTALQRWLTAHPVPTDIQ